LLIFKCVIQNIIMHGLVYHGIVVGINEKDVCGSVFQGFYGIVSHEIWICSLFEGEDIFSPEFKETAEILNETKRSGGRVICVGTTSCRTLESLVNEDGSFEEKSKWTEIFIYPGYTFKAMDGLITNFHLPESTLVMLVSAFAGRENVLSAYAEAVKERYRFFSFGDAMTIL